MAFSVKFESKEVESMIRKLSSLDRQRILDDASTILFNSAKLGFVRKVDPELKPWPESPKWYADMKGQNTPLSGPLTKEIKGGRFKGWEFERVNSTRMANELWKSVGKDKAEIFYKSKAKKRAKLTQFGGKSKMRIKKGGRTIEFKIKIQPRTHLGISKQYSRIPGGSDIFHIEKAVNKYMQGLIKK
jgi:hypothetical protein